jgi:hypothetical protein
MSVFPNALAFEALTPTEIAKAATIFDNLKLLRIKLKNGDENILEKAFEIHVQSLLEKLEGRLTTFQHNAQSQKIEIILAKHGLYDAAFQQVILLCQSSKFISTYILLSLTPLSLSPVSPILGDGIKELRNVHSNFLSDFQSVCSSYTDDIQRLHDELNHNSSVVSTLQENIHKLEETIKLLDNEAELQNKKIIDLRNNLRSATQEINYMRETPLAAGSSATGLGMSGELRKSQQQAGGFFDTSGASGMVFGNGREGIKRSNSAGSLSLGGGRGAGGGEVSEEGGSTGGGRGRSRSPSPHYGRSTGNTKRSSSTGRFHFQLEGSGDNNSVTDTMTRSGTGGPGGGASSLQSPARGTMAFLSPIQWLHSFREDVQRAMDDGRCRLISINECKEIIKQIYDSKVIANEKSLQGVGNLPFETVEQHTYRILEKKYGLRSLAVGHAGMLLKALEIYSNEDNEISVFSKIFNNEIEEDFRFVQEELLKSIRELTMVQLMGRNPLKDSAHLQRLLEEKINVGCIYEDEWKDMINYLYNSSDATTLGVLLKRQALLERDDSPAIAAMSLSSSIGGAGGDIGLGNTNQFSSSSASGIPSSSPHFLQGNTLLTHKIQKPNSTYVVGTPNVVYHSTDTFQTGKELGYDKSNVKDTKRLGYQSPTLKIAIKDPKEKTKTSRKDYLKLSFLIFIKIILDFQLRSHIEYLANFLHLFRQFDKDVDGVLNGGEFKDFFHILYQNTPHINQQTNGRNGNEGGIMTRAQEEEEELKTLLTLVKLIDPHQHDRFVFSSTVICLQKIQ